MKSKELENLKNNRDKLDTNEKESSINQKQEITQNESAGEIEAYSKICSSASSSITWLIFAIAICSGIIALCLLTFYFGNLKYAIERRKAVSEGLKCNGYNTLNMNSNIARLEIFGQRNRQDSNSFLKNTNQNLVNANRNNDTSNTYHEKCKKTLARVEYYEQLEGQTQIITLPIVNLKLVVTDFILVVLFIGMFFWFWLWHTLKYTRSMLCSFYNATHFSEHTSHTISNYFLLLWTGGTRKTFRNIPQYIFIFLLIIILVVIFSDFYDHFIKLDSITRLTTNDDYGWEIFSHYLLGKVFLEVIIFITGIGLFYTCSNLIRDLRNLLLLVEWSDRSLYPMLHNLFEKINAPLVSKGNEISYEEEDSRNNDFYLKLRLNFLNSEIKGNIPKKGKERGIIFSAPVNLAKKALEFSKRHNENRKAPDWMLNEKEKKGISTTFEERRMRRFFYEMLINEDFGEEISTEFNAKVINNLPKIINPDLKDNDLPNEIIKLKKYLKILISEDI